MGLPSYMWSIVDRNVVMRRITVLTMFTYGAGSHFLQIAEMHQM